jgi:predicted phosphoribosyltransferase
MFADRRQAAGQLAERLAHHRGTDPLVLAVPRGAVPMAEVIAAALDGELDVVLVHKLGAPGNREYAIGAVSENGEVLLRPQVYELGLDLRWLQAEVAEELAELKRRRTLFTPGRGAADVAGRTVIVVDDGVATGATLAAALRLVRRGTPRRLVAAVAVAPAGVSTRLGDVADEVVCLEEPVVFLAVGEHFADFRQVADEEVVAILARAAARRPAETTTTAATPPGR